MIEELLLSKEDALIFEDWGMGEDLYHPEDILEVGEGLEFEYTNPRLATINDIEPYYELLIHLEKTD